jgi:hypothetical protein
MSYRILLATASLGLALALGGCGEDPGTRALSGGAIGAGGGAVLGAVTGLGPGAGAAIGAVGGAIAGASTAPGR